MSASVMISPLMSVNESDDQACKAATCMANRIFALLEAARSHARSSQCLTVRLSCLLTPQFAGHGEDRVPSDDNEDGEGEAGWVR